MLLYGWFTLLGSVCIFTNTVIGDGVPCGKRVGLCGCVFKNERGEDMEIKMSALNKKDGTPFFRKIQGRGRWVYELNLCTGFTTTSRPGCSDVTGCQRSPTLAFAIGKPGTEEFGNYMVNKPLVVAYTAHTKDNTTRYTIINLICKEDAENATAKFVEEVDNKEGDLYFFDITSKHLCPGKPSTHSGKSNIEGIW